MPLPLARYPLLLAAAILATPQAATAGNAARFHIKAGSTNNCSALMKANSRGNILVLDKDKKQVGKLKAKGDFATLHNGYFIQLDGGYTGTMDQTLEFLTNGYSVLTIHFSSKPDDPAMDVTQGNASKVSRDGAGNWIIDITR